MRSLRSYSSSLHRGDCSCVELVQELLARIRKSTLGAYLASDADAALAAARRADGRLAGGNVPLLCGIPYAVKDNICTKALPTTAGSALLAGFQPTENAPAIDALEDEFAVLLGKTALDEFGMGSATAQTHHPLDPARVPGGSSGGSAAAVAAGEAVFALGSDTGGSVRQPAAFCGLAGFRPTYGAISRRGLIAFAPSMDQIGILAPTAGDCAWVFTALSRPDAGDATCRPAPIPYPAAPDFSRLRVALVPELCAGAEPEILAAVCRAAEALCALGATVEELSLPILSEGTFCYTVLSSAEASSTLSRYDGIRYGRRAQGAESADALITRSRTEGFGAEVRRRILCGQIALTEPWRAALYDTAVRLRGEIRAALSQALRNYDLLLSPAALTVAFRRDALPENALALDLPALPASLAGLPALALPAGRGRENLPVGVQLMAAPGRDMLLLCAGEELEAWL